MGLDELLDAGSVLQRRASQGLSSPDHKSAAGGAALSYSVCDIIHSGFCINSVRKLIFYVNISFSKYTKHRVENSRPLALRPCFLEPTMLSESLAVRLSLYLASSPGDAERTLPLSIQATALGHSGERASWCKYCKKNSHRADHWKFCPSLNPSQATSQVGGLRLVINKRKPQFPHW